MKLAFFSSFIFFLLFSSCFKNNKKESKAHSRGLEHLQEEGIKTQEYYSNWSGHKVELLEKALKHLKEKSKCERIVFLAGDSSLDNKHWIFPPLNKSRASSYKENQTCTKSLEVYKDFFNPSFMPKDVNYWIGKSLESLQSEEKVCSIMTAVEASTLMKGGKLRSEPQDRFIRKNIKDGDYLIISVGGNDIAMAPTAKTEKHLEELIQSDFTKESSKKYFISLFKGRVKEYILSLIGDKKPKNILIAMIYYPGFHGVEQSWAYPTLKKLHYDKPDKRQLLQGFIKFLYEEATSQIKIDGARVTALPLYEVLDGSNPEHYKSSVEPSVEGGRLLGEFYVRKLQN